MTTTIGVAIQTAVLAESRLGVLTAEQFFEARNSSGDLSVALPGANTLQVVRARGQDEYGIEAAGPVQSRLGGGRRLRGGNVDAPSIRRARWQLSPSRRTRAPAVDRERLGLLSLTRPIPRRLATRTSPLSTLTYGLVALKVTSLSEITKLESTPKEALQDSGRSAIR